MRDVERKSDIVWSSLVRGIFVFPRFSLGDYVTISLMSIKVELAAGGAVRGVDADFFAVESGN